MFKRLNKKWRWSSQIKAKNIEEKTLASEENVNKNMGDFQKKE